MLTYELIREARKRIAAVVHRTPVLTSRSLNRVTGREVFFKCENLQRAGAFKIRGASNKILALAPDQRARGVVAFSSGNHAQAVALAAHEAATHAVVVMPRDAPQAKLAAAREYGAEIIFYDRLHDDREQIARQVAESRRATLVPPYDDYLIMAGQGTCAAELLEEVPDLDGLLVPFGGGGLFAGASVAAKACRPDISCFAVEPVAANDAQLSLQRGERVCIPPPQTIADGARPQAPGALTFPILQQNAEDVLTVSDEELVVALRFILFRMKLLVEPTGALAAAAVLFDRLPKRVRRVGVILSGGNIDGDFLASLVKDGGP